MPHCLLPALFEQDDIENMVDGDLSLTSFFNITKGRIRFHICPTSTLSYSNGLRIPKQNCHSLIHNARRTLFETSLAFRRIKEYLTRVVPDTILAKVTVSKALQKSVYIIDWGKVLVDLQREFSRFSLESKFCKHFSCLSFFETQVRTMVWGILCPATWMFN